MKELHSFIQKSPQWMEPYFFSYLPMLMDNMGSYKTSEQAKETGVAILEKMNSHSMRMVTDILYEGLTSMKWQTKKGALILLGTFGNIQKDVVQRNLPSMILRLIDMASDVKREVKEQTRKCFTELCSVIDNVDVIKIIPDVIDAYM